MCTQLQFYIHLHYCLLCVYPSQILFCTSLSTVFPRIVRARSINFASVILRGQFEGAILISGAAAQRTHSRMETLLSHVQYTTVPGFPAMLRQ